MTPWTNDASASAAATQRSAHKAHLWALRAAPLILWGLSIYLILVGTLGSEPEASAISAQILGFFLAISGAVVTRADELIVKRDSVQAKMVSVLAIDPGTFGAQITPNSAPSKAITQGSEGEDTVTVADIIAAARAQGWTIAQTSGSRHILVTKTNVQPPAGSRSLGRGDSITLTLPIDNIGQPVTPYVLAVAREAGLQLSQPGPTRG